MAASGYFRLSNDNALQPVVPPPTTESGLSSEEASRLLLRDGPNAVYRKRANHCLLLLNHFWGPMQVCMWLAILLEGIILQTSTMGSLGVWLVLNAVFEWMHQRRIDRIGAGFAEKLTQQAVVKRDNRWQTVPVATIVVGDRVRIKVDSVVPGDCVISAGYVEVDQSVLTGETREVGKFQGETLRQGIVCVRGDVEAIVTATGAHTEYGKVCEEALAQSMTWKFHKNMRRITAILSAVVFTMTIILFIIVISKDKSAVEALSFSVIIGISAIPTTIRVAATAAVSIVSKVLSKQNTVVLHSKSVEELASMDLLCCDKTGTLTYNRPTVLPPVCLGALSPAGVAIVAALASQRHTESQDAIDRCIIEGTATFLQDLDGFAVKDFVKFSPSTKRTEATIENLVTGEVFRVAKGSLQTITPMCEYNSEVEGLANRLAAEGYRTIAVARTIDGSWRLVGLIPMSDPLRKDASEMIQRAHALGVDVKMITGDDLAVAMETANALGLRGSVVRFSELESQADIDTVLRRSAGFAETLPDDKSKLVKAMQRTYSRVGMIGDGVNDTLALKQADVSLAVANCAPGVVEVADIVLGAPGLAVVVSAIMWSRELFQRTEGYLVYRVASSCYFLLFFFIAMVSVDPSTYGCDGHHSCSEIPTIFMLPPLAIAVTGFINTWTGLSLAFDRATPSSSPNVWNLWRIFAAACAIGLVAALSSYVMLLYALDNMNAIYPSRLLQTFGIHTMRYEEVITTVWMQFSVQMSLMVFSARCKRFLLLHRRPSLAVGAAGVIGVVVVVVSGVWFPWDQATKDNGSSEMTIATFAVVLFVVLYCFVWFCLQEAVKVAVNLGGKVVEQRWKSRPQVREDPIIDGENIQEAEEA